MKSTLFVMVVFMFGTVHGSPLTNVPRGFSDSVFQAGVIQRIGHMRIKEFEKISGRKLKLKEKLAFWFMKKSVKKTAMKKVGEKSNRNGSASFWLGLLSVGLLFIGLGFAGNGLGLVPVILFGVGALTTAILSIIKSKAVLLKNENNADALQKRLALTGRSLSGVTLIIFCLVILIGVAINGCVNSLNF